MHNYTFPHCSATILDTADRPSQTKPAGRLCWINLLIKCAADKDGEVGHVCLLLNTQLSLSGNLTGNVPVFHNAQLSKFPHQLTMCYFYFTNVLFCCLFSSLPDTFPLCKLHLQYDALFSYCSCCVPSQSTYLGIFETEMTHVVVDQAEGKAPVHEGQAPLRGESAVSTHAAQLYTTGMILDKTNPFLRMRNSPEYAKLGRFCVFACGVQTLMKLARLRLMQRASSGISMWRMVMCGMMDNTSDCSAWWKLSGKRWARGI